jgi:hypothetical protein
MEFITWSSLRNLSNNLTTCDSILLEKLVLAHLTKQSSPFYGTYRLIALLTTVCTWTLLLTHFESNTNYLRSLKTLCNFILHLYPSIPINLFPSTYLSNILYASYPQCYMHIPLLCLRVRWLCCFRYLYSPCFPYVHTISLFHTLSTVLCHIQSNKHAYTTLW